MPFLSIIPNLTLSKLVLNVLVRMYEKLARRSAGSRGRIGAEETGDSQTEPAAGSQTSQTSSTNSRAR